MTSRERWTVYPLLLLAIGLAVRAAGVPEPELVTDTLTAAQIRCQELRIEAEDGTVLIHMGRVVNGGGGRIEIKDGSGTDTISIGTTPGDREGRVDFFDAEGRPTDSRTGHAPPAADNEYARRDSNPQPSVPKTDALSN